MSVFVSMPVSLFVIVLCVCVCACVCLWGREIVSDVAVCCSVLQCVAVCFG